MSDDLTTQDLRHALDLVHILNENGLPAALSRLGELVGCDVLSCSYVTQTPDDAVTIAVTRRPERSQPAEHRRLIHQHPAFDAYRRGLVTVSSSVAMTDIKSARKLRNIPLYQDFYRPRGTLDQLVCVLSGNGNKGAVLTVSRSKHGYTDRERSLVNLLARHFAQRTRPNAALMALTAREREVANEVARGLTDREIARQFAISPRTVHKHLEQAYRKLGLTNRTGLITLLGGQSSSAS